MADKRLDELREAVADSARRVAEGEAALEAASVDMQEVKRQWRALVVAADVDGDADAAQRMRELEAQMNTASLQRERAELALGELRNRHRRAVGDLERYTLHDMPMRYYRRKPEFRGFGALSNWAHGLAGRIPNAIHSEWEEVTADRIRYELARELPNVAEAWRLLRSGEVVHSVSFDFRAEPK